MSSSELEFLMKLTGLLTLQIFPPSSGIFPPSVAVLPAYSKLSTSDLETACLHSLSLHSATIFLQSDFLLLA
ncbi:hypothetical protein TIFTF001_016712 [Ficus carica]|uniref:Uncharacterized protein n=1 Tax=Ficus carica TaxID=3494 RepID=A0AA88AAX5_FICCA|nr:hypothetical protein TIFTF001_016712 [Ficus carica]